MVGDVNPSRNLFRQKDAHPLSVLCSGKWLQTVRSSPKVSSCELSSSPSHLSSKVGENYETESEKIHKKVIPLSSKKSFSSNYTEGSLQFTMRANGTPHFVFKLENQKDVYVASYVEDQSVYMIYLQRGESSSSPHLVGRIKVSTLSSDRVIEREFVLFSSNDQIPSNRENRGLTKKVVKKTRGTSRLSRTSFIPDLCSWDQPFKEEPSFDVEQVNLLENNLPTNTEALAVVVKQETVREEIGGWGLNFLKKSPPVVQSNDATETETSTSVTSMDVVIPSGIHGGPEDEPLSLIQRWKSQGNCDCGGWDLGCSLTHLNGQPRKDQFELLIEGSKHETIGLKIVNVHEGLYIVQFEANLSILQSFSIALAFIHCQNHRPKHL
ncbi:PREDICTED: uncharacterized protein LOC104754585 [Camelina sativa]|uniref:Uncharacterized protein LOC104754585 n=1 Tax=Camelina sativa TaxID=90675 RepID=A0ABM0WRG4_CAMSA|nr:PREDICTED: uncharacterized protein LOC104754585 [Camelina sativa]